MLVGSRPPTPDHEFTMTSPIAPLCPPIAPGVAPLHEPRRPSAGSLHDVLGFGVRSRSCAGPAASELAPNAVRWLGRGLPMSADSVSASSASSPRIPNECGY